MAMQKHKNQQHKRKARVPIVGIGFDRDVAISNIGVNDGRGLVFKDEEGNILVPSMAIVGDAYLRRTKPKVLRQLSVEPTNILLNIRYLLRSHDATLAVDTSYHDLGGCCLCVSASILILYEIIEARRMADFHPQSSPVFVAPNRENPERFGWWDIIQRFSESPYHNPDKSYGLVVDSDLRDLPAINNRDVPIWDQHYLPSSFQLLYASADVGSENYINQAIGICDKLAKTTLHQVLAAFDQDKLRKECDIEECYRMCYLGIVDKDHNE
jgi:hypothetical protein